MVVLITLAVGFWMWMMLDFILRKPLEEEPWTAIVFLSPIGAIVYLLGYYVPRALSDSDYLKTQRRFKELQTAGEAHLTAEELRELGNLYRERKRWAEALRCYQQAAKQFASQSSMRLDVAKCYRELGQRQEAIQELRQISREDPFYREPSALLASQCLGEIGDWAGALQELETHCSGSGVEEIRYQRAVCLAKTGRASEAKTVLQQIVAGARHARGDGRYWIDQAARLLKKVN